ncbi:hypothetical protein [Lignipirellula cremea]|uniref:Uncharacterized protein n=1 Tax=Lignipirellula cremea TaxID=2528010 RepID=A0A518E1W5_9BACT|nr:hypothetical protein [Lignipirellula cremea]QDU98063.1 hypothetical protein Pla8534_59240 [Lignipirellula cremea]
MIDRSYAADTSSPAAPELGWRIPIEERPPGFRRAFLRVLLASVASLCVLWFFGDDTLRVYGLVAVGLAATGTLVWLYLRTPTPGPPEENVWLTPAGLRWKNEHGGHGELSRETMQSYFLGLDPEAMRGLPALSFRLVSGLESQPIPLASPASPERVRQYLEEQLELPEQPLAEDAFRQRLKIALDAGLSWRGESLEAELLRLSLIDPVRQPNGAWRVFRVRELGAIDFLPHSLQFVLEPEHGEPVALPVLDDAADYVAEHCLPEDPHEFREMRGRIDEELTHRHQQAMRSDAQAAGFFTHCDDVQQTWIFKGTADALGRICDGLDEAAATLKPAEMGERPPRLELGGAAMPLTIQVEDFTWQGSGSFAGPPHRHRELAAAIRKKLQGKKPGDTFRIEPPNDAAERWKLQFHVTDSNYDPGEE